ncbi:MAG TPA: hypothetical protein VF914_02280 [Chloroflexia bacterium]
MGTRATIGVLNEDNSVEAIYLYWDGYPEWAGKRLVEYWSRFSKIRELFKLGDLRVIGKEIGAAHNSNDPAVLDQYPDWCRFMLRDKYAWQEDPDDEPHDAELFSSVEEFLEAGEASYALFAYLFKSGEWYVYTGCRPPGTLVAQVLQTDEAYKS